MLARLFAATLAIAASARALPAAATNADQLGREKTFSPQRTAAGDSVLEQEMDVLFGECNKQLEALMQRTRDYQREMERVQDGLLALIDKMRAENKQRFFIDATALCISFLFLFVAGGLLLRYQQKVVRKHAARIAQVPKPTAVATEIYFGRAHS